MPTAEQMRWTEVHPSIGRHEFPGDVLAHMDARLLLVLSRLRGTVDKPLYPSPVPGAHVRSEGASRHSTRGGRRLSDATDFFVDWKDAESYMVAAIRDDEIGGIGFYDAMRFRGTPGDYCMIHIDLRPGRVQWVGHGRDPVEYVYHHRDRERYVRLLLDALGPHSGF